MIMNDLLALSHVPRWSIVAHSRHQSVAEHSHRVAVIALELGVRLKLEPSLRSVVWALVHDGGECWSGDIPGTFKDSHIKAKELETSPWLKSFSEHLTDQEVALVKLADLIETATFIHKYGTGNHAAYAASRMLDEVRQFVYDNVRLLGGEALNVAEQVAEDIIHEVGRVRVG